MLLRSGKFLNKDKDMGTEINEASVMNCENVLLMFAELKEEYKVSSQKIDELIEIIRKKDAKIELLESRVVTLEKSVKNIEKKCEMQEQYSRRTSLRVILAVPAL